MLENILLLTCNQLPKSYAARDVIKSNMAVAEICKISNNRLPRSKYSNRLLNLKSRNSEGSTQVAEDGEGSGMWIQPLQPTLCFTLVLQKLRDLTWL